MAPAISRPPFSGAWWLVLSGSWFDSFSEKFWLLTRLLWCTCCSWPSGSIRLGCFVVFKLSECLDDQSRMCQLACSSFFHGPACVLVSALYCGLGWQPVRSLGQRPGQLTHWRGCWPAVCLVSVLHSRLAVARHVLFACSFSHVQCLYIAFLQYPALRRQCFDADCAVE